MTTLSEHKNAELKDYNDRTGDWTRQIRLRLVDRTWVCQLMSKDDLGSPFTPREFPLIVTTLRLAFKSWRRRVSVQLAKEREAPKEKVTDVQV